MGRLSTCTNHAGEDESNKTGLMFEEERDKDSDNDSYENYSLIL